MGRKLKEVLASKRKAPHSHVYGKSSILFLSLIRREMQQKTTIGTTACQLLVIMWSDGIPHHS
jgi:hypothetical protein